MDAYAIAESLLGDIRLSPAQLAQLRALDHQYQQCMFAMGRVRSDDPALLADMSRSSERDRGDASDATVEIADLEARISAEVIAMLTPEQRRLLRSD